MHLLLVFATHKEASSLLVPATGNYVIDTLVTGPGMVATTFALSRKLFENQYELVINAGICGSFRKDFSIGEVVNVVTDCFPEFGAEDGDDFLSASEIGLIKKDEFPFKENKLLASYISNAPTLKNLKPAHGITVNTVIGSAHTAAKITERLNPDIESMEGAAVLYTCALGKAPCLQLRAISNYVGPRDRDAWDITGALQNLNKVLIQLISEI